MTQHSLSGPVMRAEIIAIGTELTNGAKLDTNSQWLSLELENRGIPVTYHSTVSDELEAIVDSLRAAVNRSDVVLITGGLGPTLDDLTRQAMAALLQAELELHEPSLEFIKSLFARHKREMPERNMIQAMFPAGSEPLANPRGTAPGIWAEVSRKTSDTPSRVAAMPGVPGEMKRMFHHEVLPRLPQGKVVIRRARLNCFGAGESHVEEMLGDLTRRGGDPEIGITAHEATITLRIIAHGSSAEECEEKIESAKAVICERMGRFVVGEEDTELEHVLVPLLNDRKMTLCVAEAGTAGLVASRLADVDGADRCFLGGIVAVTPAVIASVLDVDPELLRNEGPISSRVAGEIATTCRARFGADFALATSPFPDDDPQQHRDEAPSAFVALAGEGFTTARSFTMLGNVDIHKSRAAKVAMNLLRLHLLK